MKRRGAGPAGRRVPAGRGVVRTAPYLVTAALALVPVPARGQGFAGDLGVFNIQRRAFYQGAAYEQTGVAVGAAGAARIGAVRLRLRGIFGTLKGDGSAPNPDVKLRTTAITAEVAVRPWLAVGAIAEARRFEANAGVSTWRLLGVTARLEPTLGLPGLGGLAELVLLPAGSVSNGPKITVAFQFLVGASYQIPRSRFHVRLGYRFERYDFEASGLSPERYEQFQGVVAEAGLRLGR